MPGYLGGGGSGGGIGGEIEFPKELIDPVTKIRMSQPETMIDTDFEYGLQPTKWETVELINNTPSFFSKSGDTTIPGILSITTNAGTREITVKTALDHGLAAGIPINVQGTKSITADGAFIINSIPDTKTFTYFCKDIQTDTLSIKDLYSSIVTGEFFQGSQIGVSDTAGIVTDGAEPISTLTVTTDSTHGFGTKTPFYFLNINSTVSQNFDSTNSTSKSFDSSNAATAQIFDGSNTLSTLNVDYSNSATVGGNTSLIFDYDTTANTITVSHSGESFAGLEVGTPLYYDINTSAGFFSNNPRGVVFLKSADQLGTVSSTFTVSELPDGAVIAIPAALSGTIQIANQARTFPGNNVDLDTQQSVTLINETPKEFDASNTAGTAGTATSFSGSLVTVNSNSGQPDLNWYFGTMVLYTVTGTPATGLTNNTTYFVDQFFPGGGNTYLFTLREFPDSQAITSIVGETATSTHVFTQIGVSTDKDIIHLKDNGFDEKDMLRYDFPQGGRFGTETVDDSKLFYFVEKKYDAHNLVLASTLGEIRPPTVQRVEINYGQTITPTTAEKIGLEDPVTFAVDSGTLPAGLSLNTTTGVVSGTPYESIAAPGREVVIKATDANGTEALQIHTYQIEESDASIDPPTISRTGILADEVMQATTATPVGMVEPITWAVIEGTLPTGLSLNNNTGVVSGTPSEEIPTARNVTIRATDVGGTQAFQTHTYQIEPAPRLYSFTSATFTTGGRTGRTGPNINQARSGVGNPSWASTYLNMTTNGIQLWTVPENGTYRIEARGARGGGNSGLGARVRIDAQLQKDEVLSIVVGQYGTDGGGSGDGGGGGSFVYTGAIGGNGLMLAAGGGGGDDDGGTNGANARSDLRPTDGSNNVQNNDGRNGRSSYEDGQGWLGTIAQENFEGELYYFENINSRRGGQGGFGGGGDSWDDGGGAGGFTGGSGNGSAGGAGGSYYAGLARGTSLSVNYTSTWANRVSNFAWLGNNGSQSGSVIITRL